MNDATRPGHSDDVRHWLVNMVAGIEDDMQRENSKHTSMELQAACNELHHLIDTDAPVDGQFLLTVLMAGAMYGPTLLREAHRYVANAKRDKETQQIADHIEDHMVRRGCSFCAARAAVAEARGIPVDTLRRRITLELFESLKQL